MAPMVLKGLVALQKSRMEEIGRIHTRFTEIVGGEHDRNIMEERIKSIKKIWDEARATHAEIITKDKAGADPYMADNLYATMEASYETVLNDFLRTLTNIDTRSPTNTRSSRRSREDDDTDMDTHIAKLPKIDLPKFSGKYEDWEEFRDLFTTLIHDSTRLANVSKLQYLKLSLEGVAADFVKEITISNANYISTWEALKERFSNPRLTVNSHLTALMNIPNLKKESANELRAFNDEAQRIVRALKNLEMPVEHWDVWLVYVLAGRLDYASRKLWESELSLKESTAEPSTSSTSNALQHAKRFPTLTEFITFIERRCHTLSMMATEPKFAKRPATSTSRSEKRSQRSLHLATATGTQPQVDKSASRKCSLCKGPHFINLCPNLLAKSPVERRDEARRLRLCFNCLGHHKFANCSSKFRCKTCHEKHHSLLHFDRPVQASSNLKTVEITTSTEETQETAGTAASPNVASFSAAALPPKRSILLATAQVIIETPRGDRVQARALLDQGSEASFITESLVKKLELPEIRTQTTISGLGASKAGVSRTLVHLNLLSTCDPWMSVKVDALALPRLTEQLPARSLAGIELGMLEGITLADPMFFESSAIDIILGADVYGHVLRAGLRRFPSSQLIAQDTVFGWILSGPTESRSSRRAVVTTLQSIKAFQCSCDVQLHEELQRFWKLEEFNEEVRGNPEDDLCEEFFVKSHYRDASGRYVVKLPLRREPPSVSDETRQIAMSSLASLHRRFKRDKKLAMAYKDFMREYETLGHMERIPPSQIKCSRSWYIPHHAVVQSNDGQWKFRVVFNASRSTKDGCSLNTFLMAGPPLLNDLSLIIVGWRRHRFVFTADIVKMFRQILIDAQDQELQRILSTPNEDDAPEDFRLKTVTYGMTCGPFHANRTIKQIAADGRTEFPLACDCLLANTYVDDVFDGDDDLTRAIEKRNQLCGLLNCAGMKLGKWAANNSELLRFAGSMDTGNCKIIEEKESVKTLGLRWNPADDVFSFTVNGLSSNAQCPTKRTVLSNIASLFDPLGWLAPITVTAKIIMQDLWILKCDWDSPLPKEVLQRWNDYIRSLMNVSSISVERWLGASSNTQCQIHAFSDASSRAYAAVVYLRAELPHNQFKVSLLIAKTKVSPVKTVSIPNLELCAAALLVRLIRHLQKLPIFGMLPIFAWTDSQIVLSWLQKHPCYWKTFVSNRVSYIQTELPSAEWRHVSTKENPADLATRGVDAAELKNHTLWWNAPHWLSQSDDHWPETQRAQTSHTLQTPAEPDILLRFSSLTRLIRVVAFCRRPIVRLRNRRAGITANLTFLTAAELADARIVVVRMAQAHAYSTELELIKSNKSLPRRHPLLKLRPFVDEQTGLLRVGGRLSHSDLSREAKHPPILPSHSALSRLFVHMAHCASLHGGFTLTCSFLLRYVWVLGRSRLIKREIRECITCQRIKPRLASQLMGDLPRSRIVPARPFERSGLDYAGPIHIRTSRGRGTRSYKGYIALFVCFTTHALHLEVVSDLTTATFLSAYRRFIGRRGICSLLYSDNATTFQGAARELREMFDAASNFYKEVAAVLANEGTNWSFIPPNSPHCGGIWEAGVKSVKHHLKRYIGEHVLTFEELTTVLIEIEACLNSRPLCPFSNDPDDLTVLTPAHFLIGGSLALVPEARIDGEVPENRLNRFQLMQSIRNQFWNRWSNEYLHHLQERGKWRTPAVNFGTGNLVLVKDDRYPPSKWPLGRVIEVHKGPDGLIRVVTVKTATTVLRRHIARLCPLYLPSPNKN